MAILICWLEFVSNCYQRQGLRGMVKLKMENRMEGLEKEMGTIKEDLGNIKYYLLELRELMRLKDGNEASQSPDKGKIAMAENSNNGENRVYDQTREIEITKEDRRIKRLELPVFNGEDPYGWTFKADRYFNINRYEAAERVEATAVCMEGRSLNWYQWVESWLPIQSW